MVDFNIHMERCNMTVNGEPIVFAPGDLMKGHVEIQLSEPLHVSHMTIVIQGAGLFNWKESNGTMNSFEEVYFKDLARIIENGDKNDSILPKGKHIFPFQCNLPKRLPSTLMGGAFGDVCYFVKCSLQTTDANISMQLSKSASFVVLNRLPMDNNLMQPHSEKMKASFPLTVKERLRQYSNCIKVNLLLARRCFLQGETIHLASSVINGSSKIIKQFDCSLELKIEYKLKGETLTQSKVISEQQELTQVGYLEGHKWKKIELRIPTHQSSSSGTTEYCVHVSYEIVFRVYVMNEEDIVLRVPIVVGCDLSTHPNEQKIESLLCRTEELTVQNYVISADEILPADGQLQPSQIQLIFAEDNSNSQRHDAAHRQQNLNSTS